MNNRPTKYAIVCLVLEKKNNLPDKMEKTHYNDLIERKIIGFVLV